MIELSSPGRQRIGGDWVDAVDGGTAEVIDPATEEAIATVPFGGAADAVRAIEAAQAALSGWRTLTAYQRGAVLARASELLRAQAASLATLTVRESGKPLAEATREWQVAADLFEFYGEEG